MITPAYAQTMAQYNQWQNRSLYGAANTLTDAQRKENRGAFFGSIHGTLAHLVFGDQSWMLRFTGDGSFQPIAKRIPDSPHAIPDWELLKATRIALDDRIIDWAAHLTQHDLDGDLTWYSGAMARDVSRPRALLIAHMFNHQTHHRGQAHALLTGFGAKPDDTDLPFMPD